MLFYKIYRERRYFATKCGNAQDHSSLELQVFTTMNPENLRIGVNQGMEIWRQGEKEGGGGGRKERAVKGGKGRKAVGDRRGRGRKGRRGREKRASLMMCLFCAPVGPALYNMRRFLLLQWF